MAKQPCGPMPRDSPRGATARKQNHALEVDLLSDAKEIASIDAD